MGTEMSGSLISSNLWQVRASNGSVGRLRRVVALACMTLPLAHPTRMPFAVGLVIEPSYVIGTKWSVAAESMAPYCGPPRRLGCPSITVFQYFVVAVILWWELCVGGRVNLTVLGCFGLLG